MWKIWWDYLICHLSKRWVRYNIHSSDSVFGNRFNNLFINVARVYFLYDQLLDSCFMLLVFVCICHCECVIKCSYLAWMKPFATILQCIQNAKICWEALAKGKRLNYCDTNYSNLLQQWRFFCLKWSTIQYQHCKIKKKLPWRMQEIGRYQSRYLVRTFIFINGVFIMLYLKSYSFAQSFDPK